MRTRDVLFFARDAALGNPLRTSLLMLAMSIGVAAVVVLTALGDGARRYVLDQFLAIGSNVVIVLPGRSQTGGFSPANAITSTTRDLSIEDAQALQRARGVRRVTPLIVGLSEVNVGGRLREAMVVGTSAEYGAMRKMELAQGRFLSEGDWTRGAPEVVLGATLRRELFGAEPAVGQLVRVGDRRLRVTGVLAARGEGLGVNADEVAFVPVATALAMFNTSSLFRVLIEAHSRDAVPAVKDEALRVIAARHDGEADVTVITQDAVLGTFDRVLGALTLAVAGIAAISLAVAGVLVMNVMLVSVTQRTGEIGLLKALGATATTIRQAFLAEAVMLSLAGALLGYALGHAGALAIRLLYPGFPAFPPAWAVAAALFTAVLTGAVFGVMPARRAAALDAVAALARH